MPSYGTTAAISDEGTPEIAAVVPYEGIYVRDNWERLTERPWWWAADPSIERQVQWRAEIRRYLAHDWFHLPECGARCERESLRIDERDDGVFMIDGRTGDATP